MASVSIPFLIQIQSPLHLGQATMEAGEYLFTQQHVPGSALRGALAEVLIKKWDMDPEGQDFKKLFTGDQALRFEPAYPATPEAWGYPFPLTARWCKIKGGFPTLDAPAWDRDNYHGAFDVLIRQVVFEEQTTALAEQGKSLPFLDNPRCPRADCGAHVEPARGSYIWASGRPAATPRLRIARHTHTAINRARGVAEDGLLYTVETIEPGSLLRGCVWVTDAQAQQVTQALAEITHLGRGARRGRGQVTVEPHGELPIGETRKRIKALTGLLHTERNFYAQVSGQAEPRDDGYYFTLDLLSPTIFGDDLTATLEPDDLGLPPGTTLVRRFVAPETIGGWWSAAKLPHPTALAAAAGSVFLYHAPAETDLDELSTRLEALRAQGIGQQRERGYGAVLPCAPFHLWTAEKEISP